MKTSAFIAHLKSHPSAQLRFVLPDGDVIPAHAHITEAGRIDKRFIDCGGTVRQTSHCTLQAWVAADTEHRLAPSKLAGVLNSASPLFHCDDLEVEIEYEDCALSQFPVLEANADGGVLSFQLGSKHSACLAEDVCLPPGSTHGCCSA